MCSTQIFANFQHVHIGVVGQKQPQFHVEEDYNIRLLRISCFQNFRAFTPVQRVFYHQLVEISLLNMFY
jgi:hypothetical protein